MLSLDPHDKFSVINTRRLSRRLVSGSSLSGSPGGAKIKNNFLYQEIKNMLRTF